MAREDSIKLTIKSLLEVVQTGAKNIEISVLDGYGKVVASFMSFDRYGSTINNTPLRILILQKSRVLYKRLSERKKLVRAYRVAR